MNWLLKALCASMLIAGVASAADFTEEDTRTWEEIQADYLFELIGLNVDNLDFASTSSTAAGELVCLLQEGYRIDSGNLLKLIELLDSAIARKNAAHVLMQAIDYRCELTPQHMVMLIKKLDHASATGQAKDIILHALDAGVPFGPVERYVLAQMSTMATARNNVEKIRKALHQRAAAR
ncbi:MAG: hypothetical protein KDK78_05355 [Chlamydiia bacterium]|nr:hypothetical protein [Chlamydiia bacterium]